MSSLEVWLPVIQAAADATHRFAGAGSHVAHVGPNHVQPEGGDEGEQPGEARLVGGDLGPEVGQVGLSGSGRGDRGGGDG